jgi:hypothetical protein
MIGQNDPRRAGFHGKLESKFEGKILIKSKYPDILINTCISKDDLLNPIQSNMSQIKCPKIEIEHNILSGSNAFCLNSNDCKKELYFICNYDINKNIDDKADSLVYADTLQNYQQDPKMSYVMNSFLAVAFGLNRIHQKVD